MKRPSPPICRGCYRPHVRLPADFKGERRAALVTAFEWDDPVTRLYVSLLFDHLTIGAKVADPKEPGQLHPAPPIPRTWTAEEFSDRAHRVLDFAHSFDSMDATRSRRKRPAKPE